jgi:hypothetical protein
VEGRAALRAFWLAAAAAAASAAPGCTHAPKPIVNHYGVVSCPASAGEALLSVDALQCWFAADHGQWRVLSHESHYDVLVVRVEAFDLRDAEGITRRFVANQGGSFSEIMVYAQPRAHAGPARIRRVRWTRERGSDTFDFVAPGIEP